MGHISIACYKPKPGQDAALEALVRDHLPRLSSFGLVTDRASIIGRAKDGTFVEIFEWNGLDAIEQAHGHSGVQQMWEEFGAVCDYVPFGILAEAQDLFAGLTPV